MRFSAVAALCAAPLVLAGTLQADLVARGAVGLEAGLSVESSSGNSKGKDNVKSSSNGSNGNDRNGGNVIVSNSITEVIIIWVNNGGGAPTTTIQPTSTFALQTNVGSGSTEQSSVAGVAAAPASQATHTVIVGGSAGLAYTPDSVVAAIGDMVIFTFLEQNHTATQSAFTTPCEALAGGIDSGFMPNPNSSVVPPPQMAMQVTVATPIWFYCKQKGHCGKGMTFSINPTQNKTQAMFQQMAVAQNGTGTTAVIAGGSSTGATSSVAAAGAAATSSANAGSSGTLATGTGTIDGTGACQCSCLCGAASFPNAAIQGVDAFGGVPGAMPLNALMT